MRHAYGGFQPRAVARGVLVFDARARGRCPDLRSASGCRGRATQRCATNPSAAQQGSRPASVSAQVVSEGHSRSLSQVVAFSSRRHVPGSCRRWPRIDDFPVERAAAPVAVGEFGRWRPQKRATENTAIAISILITTVPRCRDLDCREAGGQFAVAIPAIDVRLPRRHGHSYRAGRGTRDG